MFGMDFFFLYYEESETGCDNNSIGSVADSFKLRKCSWLFTQQGIQLDAE